MGGLAIRVSAMVVLPSHVGAAHAVSLLPASQENPDGFHRLVGGGVEVGETALDAVVREVHEELGAVLAEPVLLGVLENIFHLDGELGHEVVFVHTGRLDPDGVVPPEGATFADNGRPMPVLWRPVEDAGMSIPLYPHGAGNLARRAVSLRRD